MPTRNLIPRKSTLLLAGVGAALVANQVVLVSIVSRITDPGAKTPLVFVLALSAGLALVLAPSLRRIDSTRKTLLFIFVAGLLMRAVWFGATAAIEDDYNRYMWDGAVVAHALDPYRYAPQLFLSADAFPKEYAAIAGAGRSTLALVNFPHLGSLYPSVAQLSFALAYFIAPFNLDALRAVFLAAEIVTFLLLIALFAEMKISPLWSALYWWNPLPIFTLIGMAHVDALVPPFVLGAILLAKRAWPNAAVAMLGAGAGVKIWPLLLAPLFIMPLIRQPKRLACAALVFVAVLALAIGPLMLSVFHPSSGLAAYTASWDVNNAFFAWGIHGLELALGDEEPAQTLLRSLLAVATAGTALFVALRRQQQEHDLVCGALIVSATVFYLSPAQFPWYAAWFLPLATLLRSWPLLLASATLPLCYLVDPLWQAGWGSAYHYGVAFLHSVPVFLWLLIDALRRRWTSLKANDERKL